MSTRCNIIVRAGVGSNWYQELCFYRHSDGYPEGAMPLLEKFLEFVKNGHIRDNVEQAAGWLILLGACEHQTVPPAWFKNHRTEEYGSYWDGPNMAAFPSSEVPGTGMDWKVGSIEPCECIHADIEFLYIVDLNTKEILIDPPYHGKLGDWGGVEPTED